jgi:hypothetical protein
MNSKEFIQSLRKIIREEVQSAVRSEVSKLANVISESRNMDIGTFEPEPVKTKPRKYTENTTLNDLLNETVGFSSNGPQVSYDSKIDYNDFSEWPTMRRNSAIASRAVPTIMTDINGSAVDMTQLAKTEAGAAVVTALTKDYSSLMSRIKDKKGS